MTRTAIRHTLSAFAAVALISTFASSPASAHKAWHCSNFRMEIGDLPSKPKTPNGLATKSKENKANTERELMDLLSEGRRN